MWKSAVEAAERSLRFARGEQAAGMNAIRQIGKRQPRGASGGPIDAETAEVAQQTAIEAAARLLALSNESPKTLQSVSRLLGEVMERSGGNASQPAACMQLVIDNMLSPQDEQENSRRLLAILRLHPEILQVHPMYRGTSPLRNAQPLSCSVALHLVSTMLSKGMNLESRRLSTQVLRDVRGSIGSVAPQRIMPTQLDCGYFLLVAGNMEMLGIGGDANPVLANELFVECKSFIDACALNSAVLQLADKVESPGREAIANSLVRLQNSAYPEIASRSRQLLASHFSSSERFNASLNPLERGFLQFIALGAAVHSACQADEDCRKRAASISSSAPDEYSRQADAQRRRDGAYYEGALRAGQESVDTGGRGNMLGCHMSQAFCSSKY